MITLTEKSVTTTTTLTDTLCVSSVTIDLIEGVLGATIQRGLIESSGKFTSNMPDVQIRVQPDGSFTSGGIPRLERGSSWEGTVKGVPELIATLRAQFDQMVVSSGFVTGTAVPVAPEVVPVTVVEPVV